MDPKYPCSLVVQNLEPEDDKGSQLQIPEGRIRGCFHGWVILSNNDMWSIWNPVTCKVIHLPPLILEDVDCESIDECCLSSPPDDPRSLLLLTRYEKPSFVFYRLDGRLGWSVMSYAKELKSMEFPRHSFLYGLTCYNGEVYALNSEWCGNLVMHVDINVVKDEEVVINILPFVDLPYPLFSCYSSYSPFLKGSSIENQLFYIILGFDEVELISGVYIFKLDMTRMIWEELQDLKDAIFFLDLAHDDDLVYYRSKIASELGGYIHILSRNGEAMHSLHVRDKIVSLSSMPSCLVSLSRLSLWECSSDATLSSGRDKSLQITYELFSITVTSATKSSRSHRNQNKLPFDHGEIKCRADSKPVEGNNGDSIMLDISSTKNEYNESHLLNIPFNVLEMIMELCVGVEYLNFRATCKTCQLGAPIIRWSKATALSRLQTPWLVVVNHRQGLITFTDPVFGDNYFIKTPRELNGDMRILCSRYGWLLMKMVQPLVMNGIGNPRLVFFINPFTRDIRELPEVHVDMFCFSAPPTSPDCMVVGFSECSQHVFIHFVAGEPYWRMIVVDANSLSLRFPTFHGQHLYALCKGGGLFIIREIEDVQDYSWRSVTAKAPTSSHTQYFLVKGDEHFLLVKMGEFGEDIQLFKLNDFTKEWEKINGLGRHVIYICDTTCICVEAKTREMENKIYFPRLRSENRKIVFYSLATCTYHTSDGENIEQNLFGTQQHAYTHTWIQPSWS